LVLHAYFILVFKLPKKALEKGISIVLIALKMLKLESFWIQEPFYFSLYNRSKVYNNIKASEEKQVLIEEILNIFLRKAVF